ncbi:peptidoglycan editing factor PgeF [Metabacillus iocasae]|uniref:Purine nucleoside phosphorylase n=1 Tax=Priestia iocasae TaxID=2291674 RepID=A0ABS2QQQ4_9BACI|nr:peptidoglycan editing factor PgeF [Metabacillus iocasae]MBM7701785.1 YfiH family protein [Metabacillus iocasae]
MNPDIFQLNEHESTMTLQKWTEESKDLIVGFTTKNGGVSHHPFASLNLGLHVNDEKEKVIQNRQIVSDNLNMSLSQWICAEQVHENKIVKVTTRDVEKGVYEYKDGVQATDGIYTNEPNLLLSLCFADCVPLYFFVPNQSLIGLAHAGWKGTVKDIAGNMIRKWVHEENVLAKEIFVAIGPSIGDCCYVVDDRVIEEVRHVLGYEDSAVSYQIVSEGQYALDLKEVNKLLIQKAGVPTENIITSSYCTSCHEELFFSHRRDKGQTGRMLSYIGFRED